MADWYVNPDATGAGNGTSESDAYTTLQAAETAKNADITGTESVVFLCSATGDTDDTTMCVFAGWTTDATHTITIKANTGRAHDGIFGNAANAYKLAVTDADSLDTRENYVTIDGIQVKLIFSSSDTFEDCIKVGTLDAGNAIIISNCVLVQEEGGGTVKYKGIEINDGDAVVDIFNCIVYGGSRRGIDIAAGATADIYNCTVTGYSSVDGIRAQTDVVATCKNCVSYNNLDDFDTIDTIDFCADDDNDGTNNVSPVGGDWANEFTTPGTVFTVKDTSANIYLGGLDQNSDAKIPAADIVGTTRPAGANPVSIGAFEFVAAAGVTIPIMIHHYKQAGGL